MNINPKLKHLYSRAGFGLNPSDAIRYENTSIPQVVDALFLDAKNSTLKTFKYSGPNEFSSSKMQPMESEMQAMESRKEMRMVSKEIVRILSVEWLQQMSNPNAAPLLEKMALFWHGHFACTIKKDVLAYSYINTIRQYAFGNFKDLVLAIAREPAMLKYLNNNVNKKKSPNENFARELLELFTIGIGNYSEQDIKEAARAFTGWSYNKTQSFEFKERNHDFGDKTFMGKSGNLNGDDIIDIILQQKETATFISTKVYKYFVNNQVNSNHIDELADVFFTSNYNIETLMRHLFSADWFYSPENVGTKIKSPIELIAGMTNSLNVEFKNPQIQFHLQKIFGQVLFAPPNVAGWKGGKSWIDNSTLMPRLNMANYFYENATLDYEVKTDLDAAETPRKLRQMDTTLHFDQFLKIIVASEESENMKLISELILQDTSNLNLEELKPFLDNNSEDQKYISLIIRLMTMPEYQMC